MPLFEFECRDCSRRFTFLVGVVAENTAPACPRCGSQHLRKLISRVARGRSDDERMDGLAERMEAHDLDDPRAVRRLVRDMSREIEAETGESLGGEMEELINAESDSSAFGPLTDNSNGDTGAIY